ncbi:MAG: AraC family transcriptional regulator [Clostridia bacterium]|nr:AraC family transcriptional regulator [Clostridia bacterium]
MAFYEHVRNNEVYYYRGDCCCFPHLHKAIELLYVLRGEKSVWLGSCHYRLQAGDLLVCPPYQTHYFESAKNSEQIVATVLADSFPQFETLCKTATPKTHVYHDVHRELEPLFRSIITVKNKFLYAGIAHYILGIFTQFVPFLTNENSKTLLLSAQLTEYIQESYTKELTLEHLANKFGYSPNYFSELFHRCFGIGVPQYVNAVRIQKSIPLLSEYCVEEVAHLCGFHSLQQYYLNFKKLHGCTPKEFLRK